MRLVLPLLAPLVIASTVPPPAPLTPEPSLAQQPEKAQANCRGKIEAVREERGLPKQQRDNATSDEPLKIAAVYKVIDGCEVLVMANDARDVRPLPEFQEGPARLKPLR